MGKVIVVTSGKGGVGKTTSTAKLRHRACPYRKDSRRDRCRCRASEP